MFEFMSSLRLFGILSFFSDVKCSGHVDPVCPSLPSSFFHSLWSSLCSSPHSAWCLGFFVQCLRQWAAVVCIPGDVPKDGRRISIRRSSICPTTSRIEVYPNQRPIPSSYQWKISDPNRCLRVLEKPSWVWFICEDTLAIWKYKQKKVFFKSSKQSSICFC